MTQINLVHLYAREMNIYGDTGNRLILQKRLEWRGYQVKTVFVNVGDPLPEDADIILGGGGQDAGQLKVERDLQEKSEILHQLADAGVPMLMVCGMYQMFCRRFITQEQQEIKGIGILAAETVASHERMIGNLEVRGKAGDIVGYENHSGKTFLDDLTKALGHVMKGAGNNGDDKSEGCTYNNVFGTYLHGPALSKNPMLADSLVRNALIRKGDDTELSPLNNELELQAQKVARTRPR